MIWIFVSALLVGGALILAGLIGVDGDSNHHHDVMGDAGLLAVFSLRNLTWASFAFGGIGLLAVITRRSDAVSIVSASTAAVVTLVGVHALFKALRRTEGGALPADALVIGAPATLVLPFDANGLGVISFRANGQVQEMPARRAPDVAALESAHFAACRIGWIENGIAVVEPASH